MLNQDSVQDLIECIQTMSELRACWKTFTQEKVDKDLNLVNNLLNNILEDHDLEKSDNG